MNTPLTIESLREMELPVRLQAVGCINTKVSGELVYIGDKILVYRYLGEEFSIRESDLENYQLAPKTKVLTLSRYTYKINGVYKQTEWRGEPFIDIDWYGISPVLIATEKKTVEINKETGEIISREVSAE